MSYCDGTCEHLNARKHKCELTGEKLAYMKWSRGIEYSVHEHRGLRDTRNGVRTCPGYNTLSLMLRGSEVDE